MFVKNFQKRQARTELLVLKELGSVIQPGLYTFGSLVNTTTLVQCFDHVRITERNLQEVEAPLMN